MSLSVALLFVFAGLTQAEYLNLLPTADASVVYFQMNASPGSTAWYSIRWTDAGFVTEPVVGHLADISDSGDVAGYTTLLNRYCGTGGSTCFLQPVCRASWKIQGLGIDVMNDWWRTFLRLDRAGQLAWMEQDAPCYSSLFGVGQPPALNGIFETTTMRQVASAQGVRLASRRYARRLITDTGRALVLSGLQLLWLDRTGTTRIRHVNRAWEAVTDARGENIVYTEEEVGELHWVADGGDFRLGLVGTAPALTADGLKLFYLDGEGALVRYDAETHSATRVGAEYYRTFALSADFVFAITRAGHIVRIDPANGETAMLQEAMPEMIAFDHQFAPFFIYCPLYCFSETMERAIWLEDGKRVRVYGQNLNQAGWRINAELYDVPLEPSSEEEAWFDVPAVITRAPREFVLYHPERAVRFRMPVTRRR
ncbi:MAG: hypothetical protein JST93_35635 [Acidobacteria bacterium]|nr:hypothetical protein [Acidobacteriota bacterium]